MERDEWLKKVHSQAELLYDQLAPAYWITFGFYANTMHIQFIEKLLGRLDTPCSLLDAACGAGRYDGMLLEAGHRVLGIDQSGHMLARASEYFPPEVFPRLSYCQVGLQEMDFQSEFNGAICIDAMEHICPEDWPVILANFQKALKPGGLLYFSVEVADASEVREAYEQARALRLPVVFGEVAHEIEAACAQIAGLDWQAIPGEQAARATYHYYPPLEQVRAWLDQAGFEIEAEGTGDGYAHFMANKQA